MAEEVKRLAARTRELSREIENIMDSAHRESEVAVRTVRAARDSFSKVGELASEVTTVVNSQADLVEEIVTHVESVRVEMRSITGEVEQVSQIGHQTSKEAAATRGSVRELQGAAHRLNQQATDLGRTASVPDVVPVPN